MEVPAHHNVVFDVNVYMDIASLAGEPFTWEKFNAVAASVAREGVPHPRNAAYDSLRAVAMCISGGFAGAETLSVHTNDHIDDTLEYKALQSQRPDPTTGYRGLGWTSTNADKLVSDLVGNVVLQSHGSRVAYRFAEGTPPLDHEDGCVFGACRFLAGDDPVSTTYCVTRDQGFLDAAAAGKLPDVVVIHPSKFVALLRKARAAACLPRLLK